MRAARNTTDRLRELIERRLAPALERAGFCWDGEGLVRDRDDVRWLLEVERARWSTQARICFTLTWGIEVPGLDEVLGEVGARPPGVESCLISGRPAAARALPPAR